jgi:fermentation-respiration switch protein FrsA (DUF1100 family)
MTLKGLSTLIPALILLLFSSSGARAFDAMDRHYIFFPNRTLQATPEAVGLAYEEVLFPAADGVPLHGWYLPGDRGKPLVLFAHGNAGNISHRLENLTGFYRLGLPVFIFDYQDIRGALAWLKQRGWEPGNMIYFGRSLGAAVALQLAVEEPPAGLVMESAFTSVAALGWRLQPLTYALFGWWALSSRYDNLTKIKQLRCPLLLFHGDHDRIVSPAMARKLFSAAPQPKTLYLIPGADHNDTCEIGGSAYWQQWQTFIDRLPLPPDKL